MTIHKSTRLTPIQRKEIADRYFHQRARIAALARDYRVSRHTIYNIIHRARVKDYSIHKSINKRYRCLQYGIKRLAKVEAAMEKKLKAKALRYHKNYPGEMMHSDNTELPMLEGKKHTDKPETLYVAIDDFSRELYAAILPDGNQYSSTAFLAQVLEECPYTIETWRTDNGTEYKGNPRKHEFMKMCQANCIQ